MSAQFSKGDRVEIIGSADEGLGAAFPVGGTGTVHTLHLFPDDGMVYVRLDGEDAMHAWFPPANLRKVEPAAEPEDKDDLYVEPKCAHCDRTFPMHDGNDCAGDWSGAEDADDVEPEPLKEGDGWSMLARQAGKASHYRFTDRGRVIFDGMAVVEKDGDGFTLTPWIEEPMRLGAVVEADVPPDLATAFVRTGLDESHPWCMSTTRAYYAWSELKNPRVLSEGITESGAS